MITEFPIGFNSVDLIYQSGETFATSQITGTRAGISHARAEHWTGTITYSNTNDAEQIRLYSALRSKQNPIFKFKIPNPFPNDPAHDLFPTITLIAVGDVERAGYREVWLTLDPDLLTQFLADNADDPNVRRREYYEDRMKNLTGHYMEFSEEGRLFQIGEKVEQDTARQKYRVNPGMRILDSVAPKGGDEVGVSIHKPTLVCGALEPMPYSYGLGGVFNSDSIEISEYIVR